MERHQLPQVVRDRLAQLHQDALNAQAMAAQVVGAYQHAVAVAAGMLGLEDKQAQFDRQTGEIVVPEAAEA